MLFHNLQYLVKHDYFFSITHAIRISKEKKLEFDFKRNFKSFAFGGTIAGPLFICQYLKVMPYLFPGEGLLIAAKKV